jgi:hypothetical protein
MTEGERLHELSYKLGRNTQGLEDLTKLFEQHCKDDDRRHGCATCAIVRQDAEQHGTPRPWARPCEHLEMVNIADLFARTRSQRGGLAACRCDVSHGAVLLMS